VLRDRSTALVEAVHKADRMVSADAPDGVHDLRVALRRTRSLLVTFRPALAHLEAERLRGELRWTGRELGGPRDVEVVYGQLEALLGGAGVGHVSGAAVALIHDEARAAHRQAFSLVAALRKGERFRGLLEDLDRLPAEVPVEDPPPDVVRRRLRKDWRRLRRRIALVDGSPGGAAAREAALHDVRKAAKRARYAAETLTPLFGPRAEHIADAAQGIQQALGDHRDTLLTTPVLRRLGARADLNVDDGAAFGRMHALEQARGETALDAYARAVHQVERPTLGNWLS